MLVRTAHRLERCVGRGANLSKGFATTSSEEKKFRPVGVWGACFDQGQPHPGVGAAPQLLREAGLLETLRGLGSRVQDHGDIARHRTGGEGSVRHRMKEAGEYAREVHDRVRSILERGELCVTLGGDHSIGTGTVAGHLAVEREAVVVWVDAHADINTVDTSSTGNVHGMPLSFNLPQLQDSVPQEISAWLVPRLSPNRLVYIGLRDVDSLEQKIIDDLQITAFNIQDVDNFGIVSTVERALRAVDPEGVRPIHLSFDIDVLDPSEAPATGTRVRYGLSLKEGVTLAEMVHRTGRLQALDMVEVNPALAKSKEEVSLTVTAAKNIILAALGHRPPQPLTFFA